MATTCLYRRLLGETFAQLPTVLQRFHDAPAGGRVRGHFRIVRGEGILRGITATLLRLPPAGARVPVRLVITVQGNRERWDRYFGGHRVRTVQWVHGEHLMERFGLATFACAVVIEGSRVRYEFQRAWLAGIAIPSWLSPYVISHVDAGETGWRAVVHLIAPWLGEIIHYEGRVEPE